MIYISFLEDYGSLVGVGKQLIQFLCRIAIHVRGAVGINVHGHCNIGMTKAGLDSLGIYTGFQQSCRTAMAQIMETNGLQTILYQWVDLNPYVQMAITGLRNIN